MIVCAADPVSEMACSVSKWMISNMRDKMDISLPLLKEKAPILHLAQATMYRALTFFLSKTL